MQPEQGKTDEARAITAQVKRNGDADGDGLGESVIFLRTAISHTENIGFQDYN